MNKSQIQAAGSCIPDSSETFHPLRRLSKAWLERKFASDFTKNRTVHKTTFNHIQPYSTTLNFNIKP